GNPDREKAAKRPLIFSDPKLGETLRGDYPQLEDTERERDWLHRNLKHADVFAEETATTKNLLKHLQHSTLFHFGGHGVSYGGFGALLLAPARADKEDAAYITANEIAKLKLIHLQLVLLAACSSGAG